MATLTVGAGKQYGTIAAAVTATQDGDVVLVDAGTYTNDFFTVSHKITMRSVGGMAIDIATAQPPNGKAIATVDTDLTIQGFGFTGAVVNDGNGAGIRYEGGDLVVDNCLFWDDQNGILGNQVFTGTMVVKNSEFGMNGAGDGRTHNIYVGEMASFTATNNYFHDANVGHEIKSRAYVNTITGNRIFDNAASTSYSIDLPNGGNDLVANNIIEKGPNAPNYSTIHFGGEATPWAGSQLTITGNTIVNDNANGIEVFNQSGLSTVSLTNNSLYGYKTNNIGAVTASGNVTLATRPTLDLSTQLPEVPPLPAPPPTTAVPASAHLQTWGRAGAVVASGAVLTVGAGGRFTSLAAALAVAKDGDTIDVAAGTYRDDYATINKKVIIEGVGGIARFIQTTQGDALQAYFTVNADATIRNVEIAGGHNGGGHEGGITLMGGNLTVVNSLIDGNDIGIQTANDPALTLSIFDTEIAGNGDESKQTNNVSIGAIGSLTMINGYIHGANWGHEFSTFAYYTDIENSRFIDGTGVTASFSIDLGQGGNAIIKNNVIEKGRDSVNDLLIHVAGDGPTYDNTNVQIIGNTFVSDMINPAHPYTYFVVADGTAEALPLITATNNTFNGGIVGSAWLQGVTTSSGNVAGPHPVLDTSAPWSAAAAPALFAPIAGPDTLRISLTDVGAPMDAVFDVYVDGLIAGGGTVAGDTPDDPPDVFTFRGTWGTGPHVVTITGTNLTGNRGLTADSLTVVSVSLDDATVTPNALVAGWTSTSYTTTLASTVLVGAGANYFWDGTAVAFIRGVTGALAVNALAPDGRVTATQALTAAGAPVLLATGTTVIGTGVDFYGTAGRTVFMRLQSGAVQVDEFASTGARTASHVMTAQGAAVPIDAATTIIGGGQDFFGNGGHTAFFRNAAGILQAWESDANGAINAWQNLAVQGPALTIAAGTTVIGAGADFYGTKGRAVFLRLQNGAVQVAEFNANGVLTANHALTAGGAAVPIDAATTIIGGGQDFFGNGGHTAFFRNAAGILQAWEADANGAINAWQNLAVQGTPLILDTATSVIGAGADFYGTGGRAVFLRLQSGAVQVAEFDPNGVLTANHALTAGGAPVPIDSATTIIGGGQDFFGNGGHTAFFRNAAGVLYAWEADTNGNILKWQNLAVQGTPVILDTATTVIGAGADFYGTGGRAVFLRLQTGAVQVHEFDQAGVLTAAHTLTAGGAPVPIDSATTVIGGGQDFFGNGGHTAFFRNGAGILYAWESDNNGAIITWQNLGVQGPAVTIGTATTVVGAGQDFFGTGGRAVFLRNPTGGLQVDEFNTNGVLTGTQAITLAGAPVFIDSATTVVGAGEDYFATGGRDAFIRAANGALMVWEVDRTGAIDLRQAFTLNNAPLLVDSAFRITGLAGDPLGIGGRGITVQEGNGPTHVWEFNAAGVRIGVL